jgi:membrane-bound lytic murein transglycosylase D
VEPGPRYEFDLVPVRGGTSLASVAESAGSDLRTLRALNPSLRRSYVPQSVGTRMIRIPTGHYARYASRLDDLVGTRSNDIAPRTVVYRGSNRQVIAFASAQDNARLSRTGPSAPMIPVSEVADNVRNDRPTARTASNAEPAPQRIRYRVRRGDTLIHIARRHGVTVRQLRNWNNIRGSHIRIGQRLTIEKPASNRG